MAPELLHETVRERASLPEGYLRHAAHQSMTVYLDDWEKAHALLGRQIERLRAAREDRRANGFPAVPKA